MKHCSTEYIMSGLNKNLSNLFLLYNSAPKEAGETNQINSQNIQNPQTHKHPSPTSGIWKCFHDVNTIMKEIGFGSSPIPLQRYVSDVTAYIQENKIIWWLFLWASNAEEKLNTCKTSQVPRQ